MNERANLPSASNAEPDLLCPGRHQAQIGLPETTSSDSEFGRKVHEYLKDRSTVLNAKEQDMADLVLEIEERILATWTQNGARRIRLHSREVRFWNKPSGQRFNSGQIDAYWISEDGRYALIEDTKSLWGEHEEAPGNMQLRDLAVLLWLNTANVEEVIVFINQPRVTRNPILCVYSTDELMRAYDEMEARVKASLAPNAPRTAGEKQCKFCRAKLVCPEAKAMAFGVVSYASSGAVAATKPGVQLAISDLNDLELVAMLERLPVAKWVFDALEAEAKARLKAGHEIQGWMLAEGRVNHPIVDAQTVYNRAQTRGVTSEAFMRCVGIGKEKLETELRAVTGLKGKALEQELRSLIDGCTEPKPCEPSLKRVKALKEAA